MKHAGANCPVGHSFYVKRTTDADEKIANHDEQLRRVIELNRFNVTVESVKLLSKQVLLTGPDERRAMKTLNRSGWTLIDERYRRRKP